MRYKLGGNGLETVRFFGIHDLAASHYVDIAETILGNLPDPEQVGINEAISLFNILRYAETGLFSTWDEDKIRRIKMLIGRFGAKLQPSNLGEFLRTVNQEAQRDFWEMFTHYKWYEKYSQDDFDQFLKTEKPAIRSMLGQNILLRSFPESMRSYFLLDPENTTILIESMATDVSQSTSRRTYLPERLTNDEIDTLVSRYLAQENCAYGYLEIIANMHEVSDRTKLKARKKSREMSKVIFSEENGFTFGVEIQFVHQDLAATFVFEKGVAKFSYDVDWITHELGQPTILNNFIYLFEFIDSFGRITLASHPSEVPVMERLINTERPDWYPAGIVFTQKNQTAVMQIFAYSQILESQGVRIESVIEWFFSEYLLNEHGISNYVVHLPSSTTSYFEKCRIIAPEIEHILKQYIYLCEDGQIDQELLAIGSRPIVVADCPSRVDKKYVYAQSDDIRRAIYYFFSDQTLLSYDSIAQKSYETMYERLNQERVHVDRIGDHLQGDLKWLLEHQYLAKADDGWLTISDPWKVRIIKELYRSEVLSYWKCGPALRHAVDRMVASGDLCVESSLFARPEKEYLNYHLNKVKYINSLDLRNRYAHGVSSPLAESEGLVQQDYLILLKVTILLVLKINDDLEQFDIASKEGHES